MSIEIENRLMIHLLMLLLFSVGSFASNEEEVLSQINHALAAMKVGPALATTGDVSKDATCSFAEMCGIFRPNRNSKYLYKDAEGKVIQNMHLLETFDSLRICRDSLNKEKDKEKNEELKNPSESGWQAHQLRIQKFKKDLLDSIKKNKEQSKYLAMEATITNMAMQDSMTGNYPETNTRDQVDQQIRGYEKRARIRLSDESRRKWVNLLDPENYKYKDPMVPAVDSLVADDPFQNPSLLIDAAHAGSAENFQKYVGQIDAETKRIQKIFEDVRGRITKVLEGKKTASNATKIDEMIKRVETIVFKPLDNFEPDALKEKGCGSPNAFYTGETHSFSICPQMLNQPEAAVATVIAHEMGHAIDPCTLTFPLIKSDKEYFISGKIKEAPFAQKFGYSENPLSSVVSCLASASSVSARTADVSAAKKNVESRISLLKARGATEDDAAVKSLRGTLDRLQPHVEEKKACSDLPGKSEMQEVFADWVAAKVLSQKVSELPQDKKKIYAIESQSVFLMSECISAKPDVQVDLDKLVEGTSCDSGVFNKDLANIQAASISDEHPDASVRVNKIYLVEPELRKSLSCNSKPESVSCE